MKNKIYFLPFLLLILISCGNNRKKQTKLNSNKAHYTLKIQDTISIHLNKNSAYNNIYILQTVDSSEYITTNPPQKNLLIIFSLKEHSLKKQIKYNETGFNGVGIVRFALIHNFDSIFTVRYLTNRFFLTDSTAKVKRRYKISETVQGKFIYNISASYASPMVLYNKKLFLRNIPNIKVFTKAFWNKKLALLYHLTDNKTYAYGNYPEIYKKGINFGGYNYNYNRIINKHGQSIFSFSMDNHLYVYNDTALIKKVPVPSHYVKEDAPVPKKKLTGYNYEDDWLYDMSRGSYKWMVYDKYHNMIYRLVLHSMPAYDGEGNRNKWEDKPFSIQIIDSNFRLVGEVPFPGKTYYFRNIMASKSGLLISLSHDKNPITEENKLILARFKLVKKK